LGGGFKDVFAAKQCAQKANPGIEEHYDQHIEDGGKKDQIQDQSD